MIAFLVPGALDQLTGGYLFDRHVIEGLRAGGRAVEAIELAGRYPEPDVTARTAAAAALARLPDGVVAVIDGLALLAFADCLEREAKRLKIVAFVHHPLADETGLSERERNRVGFLEARLLKLARGVLAPSESTARLVAAYGVQRARIAVTPPGTAKPAPPLRRRPTRSRIEFLCVASLTPRKGHLILIEALTRLADRSWACRCIGSLTRDRETAAAVRYEIGRRGLKGRIALEGEWAPERLGEAYAAADAAVLPSFHEGYGMALAEALAHGLPVISTTAGAIPGTVPASAGLLVPTGDAVAFAEALRRFLDEPPLRARLAAGARKAGARLPDWPQAVAGWAAALDRLAA
ncbi:MAG TPA: glycosyltransferase family 4 protein [Stellaceae bacterium]|nr:glycosyltransferase family 4 protein [Stellaceae bacterium]